MDWENDINGMRCFLIPWDGGICDEGNSCHSGGKLWSPTHTELLYRQQRFTALVDSHSWLSAASEFHCQWNRLAGRRCKGSGDWKTAENRPKRKVIMLSTWKAGEQKAGKVRGYTWIPLSVFLSCFFPGSPVAHRGACILVLGFWVEALWGPHSSWKTTSLL